MKRKLPKTHKHLENLLLNADREGYARRMSYEEENKKKKQEQADEARKIVHLVALKEITQLTSIVGQLISEVARAMQSEKGQL